MKKINKRSLKYGSYALISTVILIAVIVVINAILGLDAIRDRARFDITKNKLFSLSDATVAMLEDLDKEVEIIILTDEKYYQGSDILEVLKQYNLKSNGKVTTRFVDVEKDPTFIEREIDPNQVKGISQDSIVVKCGKNSKLVSEDDMLEYDYSTYTPYPVAVKIEQAFSSAIKSVTSDYTPVTYFVTGHGEMTSNLTELKSAIIANNYEIKELSLSNPVPEDAAVIFFVSPKTDLLPKELDNLLAYMENGGDAIFLMDVQETEKGMPNFDTVFDRYALTLNNDLVLEGDQNWYLEDFTIIIPQPNENEVTMNLDPKSMFVYLPNCRSVSIKQVAEEEIFAQPLFMTSDRAQSTSLDTGDITMGPFLLGALSEYQGTESSKIALIGNAGFITDGWMQNVNYNGTRYILSTLNWMQDKTDSIIVPSKSLMSEPIQLSESTRFISFIALSFLLPLAIIGFGMFVWIRRKHL
ncbi:MAG: GldG family protein [Clostridiaceae bacterium]|nr:GldG family protein [Clostridiaceae bacterium]